LKTLCHISLDAITQNYQYFQSRVSPAFVIPVVKANAYGHGAVRITQHLHEKLGVKTFAVATLEEAQELAIDFPDITILIFSRVFPSELSSLPANAILTIGSMHDAEALLTSGVAKLKVHLNVNTGMNRLGVTTEQALELIGNSITNLQILGVYSHFSSSDIHASDAFRNQKNAFSKFVNQARGMGFKGLVHFSNNAGTFHQECPLYDAVRLGIGLYGFDTSPEAHFQKFLSEAMEVKAPLIRVERIQAGEAVSYAEKWLASVNTNIGTLRIGYADGYSRSLTNRGMVSLMGNKYPVVGTVTMDHIMIDLGEDTPEMGEMFTVFGGSSAEVSISRVAKILNTIPYEICCGISQRVIRKY